MKAKEKAAKEKKIEKTLPSIALRRSGVLLHPTSLPGPYYNGDLGEEAYAFADFLADSGQSWWQMLPINPVGPGDSPYATVSTFACEELLINLENLVKKGFLKKTELKKPHVKDPSQVDYKAARSFRGRILRLAYERAKTNGFFESSEEWRLFCERHAFWLPDYTLFQALSQKFNTNIWALWPPEYGKRDPSTIDAERCALRDDIRFLEFTQFLFDRDWFAFKTYCNSKGIGLIGDLPIFVASESADVWSNQDLFYLKDDGFPSVVAGVPPDYFNPDGQHWGNALYKWTTMRARNYAWWIERLKRQLLLFDACRLDHFIGFYRYWEIPSDAKSAKQGRWVEGPREDFFQVAEKILGPLPVVAEDLGLVTPEIWALRDQFNYPGMRVLQFAFGEDGYHIPFNFTKNFVVYTGTHDNPPMLAWYDALRGDVLKRKSSQGRTKKTKKEKGALSVPPDQDKARAAFEHLHTYLDLPLTASAKDICHTLIRDAMASVANMAIFPIQDILGLGKNARMNTPGTPAGNWRWRLPQEWLKSKLSEDLNKLTKACGRLS